MNKYDLNENEALEFAEKEREFLLSQAVNGLHSGTVIATKEDGTHTLELHWNPELKKLVEVDTWWVRDGYDDVAQDFEVLATYETVSEAIQLAAKY